MLEEKGVDVGLKSTGKLFNASQEYFVKQNEYVNLNGSEVVSVEIKDGAKIESYTYCGERKEIGSYIYENASGQKFLVLCFERYFVGEFSLKQYARQKQLTEGTERICGKELPVTLYGNPDVYTLCKKNESGMAVYIGNFFEDGIDEREVKLDGEYSDAEFVNCTGRISEDKVIIDRLSSYSFAAFKIIKQ